MASTRRSAGGTLSRCFWKGRRVLQVAAGTCDCFLEERIVEPLAFDAVVEALSGHRSSGVQGNRPPSVEESPRG